MMGRRSIGESAAALREAFDGSFAHEPSVESKVASSFLCLRTHDRAFALDLAGVAGLFKNRRIVPVPGSAAAFLGLATFRGDIAPVYDLGAILGHRGGNEAPAWMVLLLGRTPVAVAFDMFERQVRVDPEGIRTASRPGAIAEESIETSDGPCAVLRAAGLLHAITAAQPQVQRSVDR
jgi:chemotaxis signal transduction protein